EWQVPAKLARSSSHDREALGIGDDLAGEKRSFKTRKRLFTRHARRRGGDAVTFLGGLALRLHGGEAACRDGRLDRRGRNPQRLSFDGRPAARSLLSGAVEDLV